jgi:hypothetical protein
MALLGLIVLFSAAAFRQSAVLSSGPEYASDGQLRFPERYRDWVYLTSGFDMSYNPAMQMDHHMFDNVFVNPEAYQAFVKTGAWPDKTMLVLEVRGAESKGSINQAGNYQSVSVMGFEVHVKDEERFPGKWAFFGFADGKTAKMIPQSAIHATRRTQQWIPRLSSFIQLFCRLPRARALSAQRTKRTRHNRKTLLPAPVSPHPRVPHIPRRLCPQWSRAICRLRCSPGLFRSIGIRIWQGQGFNPKSGQQVRTAE